MSMEKNLKKIGVMFLVITAIMFGSLIGLFSRSTLVQILTIVVIVSCIIIGHFLITKKMNQINPQKPIEVLIIFFADLVFGLFAGTITGLSNPFMQLISVGLIAICGFITFFILYLKSPLEDVLEN